MSNELASLDLIAAFVAVMEEGSLSGAARRLSRAQPTLRRQIESLESGLGLKLFTRSANGLVPTETANALLPSAQSVGSHAAAFVRTASAHADQLAGTVRLTASRLLATYHLPRFLVTARHERPQVTVELAAEDRVENLLEREADIALRFAEPSQLALIARRLPPLELGFYANPALAASAAHLETEVDLLREAPMIWSDTDSSLDRAAESLGLSSPTKPALRTDDQIVQVESIRAGLGVGLCQAGIARELGLVRLAPDWRFELPIWLVMHEDQAQIRRIRFVFDRLVAWFGQQ